MSMENLARRAITPRPDDDVGQALHELADTLAQRHGGQRQVSVEAIHEAIDQLRPGEHVSAHTQPRQTRDNVIALPDGERPFTTATKASSVLVIGAMGYIHVQIRNALRRKGYDTTVAHSVDDVTCLITNHDYQYVILDLNIPTPREGLWVLDGLKKSVILHNMAFKIIVMSGGIAASGLQQDVMSRGADRFLLRDNGWQARLLQFIASP